MKRDVEGAVGHEPGSGSARMSTSSRQRASSPQNCRPRRGVEVGGRPRAEPGTTSRRPGRPFNCRT
eukprot:5947652-Pyramimonas_sp.AAC.1